MPRTEVFGNVLSNHQKVLQLSEFVDPYNNITFSKDKFALISYTNLQSEALMRMQMLGIISYLFQSLEEYGLKDTDCYVKEVTDEEWIKKRETVKEFLTYMLEDPMKNTRIKNSV